jgi:hypothetical protein
MANDDTTFKATTSFGKALGRGAFGELGGFPRTVALKALRSMALSALAAAAVSTSSGQSHAQSSSNEHHRDDPSDTRNNELEEKGRRLHSAIMELAAKLPTTKKPFLNVPSGVPGPDPAATDVSALVGKFITTSMTFDEAEAILRAAGIKIEWARQRNPIVVETNPLAFATGATMDEDTSTGKVHLDLLIIPEHPADYTRVAQVRASIKKQN